MGVHGLFDVLRDHSQRRSLKRMAHDAFADTRGKHRALRLGIDAAIWLVHSQWGKSGANPMLRTLFYRLLELLEMGILPVVVFDGPHKPRQKRGQNVGPTRVTALQKQICEFCDAMGVEHRIAPGEAEAELIDAVMSDDGDTLLFGTPMLIRNLGKNLSGSRAQEAARSPSKRRAGTDDEEEDPEADAKYYAPDIDCFTLAHIESRIGIDSDGMILIALLSGADYDTEGLARCGALTAKALAQAGFGTSLCNARRSLKGTELDNFLVQWREDVREELRTNSRGLLSSRKIKLAGELPDIFPSMAVLDSYLRPATTQRSRYADMASPLLWAGTFDLVKVTTLCREYFEWTHDEVLQKCRNRIFVPMIMRTILDRVAPNRSLPFGARPDMEKVALAAAATESDPTGLHSFGFVKLESVKPTNVPFASANRFRISIHLPESVALVRSTFDAVDDNVGKMDARRRQERIAVGEDPDRETRKAMTIEDPDTAKRYWLPAMHVREVAPGLAAERQAKLDAKEKEASEKARRATERAEAIARGEIVPRSPAKRKAPAKKASTKGKGKAKAVDQDAAPSSSPYFPIFSSSPERPVARKSKPAESDLEPDSDDEPIGGASQVTAMGALGPPSASKRRAGSSQALASQPSPTKLARTGVRTISISDEEGDEPMVDVPAIRFRPSSPVPAPAPAPVKRAKAKPLTATQAAARRAAASVSPPLPPLTPPRASPVIDLTTP